MTRRKVVIISVILLVSIIAAGALYAAVSSRDASDAKSDLKGEVIGPNPENIPKDKLPTCQPGAAGGISEAPQPCFSPEGAIYL